MLLLIAAASMASVAQGNFNAAVGFSGQQGFTCTSCHNVPDRGPLGDEQLYDPPAQVTVEGLPDSWDVGTTYTVTVTVTGGPPAAPSPAPQGGFEITSSHGAFALTEGMEDFTHVYDADQRGVTYTVEGTQMRQWQVDWSLTTMEERPGDVTFWVAAMSANGNHVVATNRSDGGEFGDSVDNVTLVVPPSQDAVDAWEAMLLSAPEVDSLDELVEGEAFTVRGRHSDPLATHIAYRLNDADWETRPAPAAKWNLEFTGGLAAGNHTLWIRSESLERQSDPVLVNLDVASLDDDAKSTPVPAGLVVGGLLAAAGWRRIR